MEKLKESVQWLVNAELVEANKKFPMFHSMHEGYAIIKEELEESQDEMKMLEMYTSQLWDSIKKNNYVLSDLTIIKNRAICLSSEAIQVAAMAQKCIDSFKDK